VGGDGRDSWGKRRLMRLTALEKRAVNSPKHAERTVSVALDLLDHVTLPERPKCLELGCGQGALARLLVERFQARMTATDFDPDQVRLAASRLGDLGDRVTFQVVDARHLPFADGAFDVVFSFAVMHHIAGGWRQVVTEVSRVLSPTGRFVFTDVYLPRWFARVYGKLFPRFDQLAFAPLEEVLAENGLKITHQAWERHGGMAHGKTVASKT
jgi:ubiquinone/menaquinone biosynthesis C-methylase UbiE